MANLYGQVISDKGTTNATRCGNRSIRASAQSWDGSVIVIARRDLKDNVTFEIEIEDQGSDAFGERVFKGTLEELRNKLRS